MNSQSQSIPAAVAATLKPTGGYHALGYDGTSSTVWSHARECVITLSPSDLASPATLKSVCGPAWAVNNFPKLSKEGQVVGVDCGALSSAIISDCQSAGKYNPSIIRGAGVWDSKDGLVINSRSIWSPSGVHVNREGYCGHIYPVSRDIGFDPNTKPDGKEVEVIGKLISSYKWAHEADCVYVYGWIATAILAGALKRRPHLCITGPRGNGKSSLVSTLGKMLGSLGVSGDAQSTPAGIRQKMGNGSGYVILDEAESNASISRLIQMARTTYSDDSADGVLKGTSGGEARSFAMRLSFLLAAISPPAFEAADASRWVTVEIKHLKENAATDPSRLLIDDDYAAEVGERVKALIVSRYDIYTQSLAVIKTTIIAATGNARQAETLGGLLAGWWIFFNDEVISEADAVDVLGSLDMKAHAENQNASDEQECLESILRALVRDGQDTLSVAEAVARVRSEGAEMKRWARVLGHAGIRAEPQTISIATSDNNLGVKGLLKGTKFEHGGWGRLLKRLSGATTPTPITLASVSSRAVTVPHADPLAKKTGEVVDLFTAKVAR